MKNLKPIVCVGLLFLSVLTTAAESAISEPAARPLNRFSASARFGLNINADFRQQPLLEKVVSSNPGRSGGAALDRFYDDGYVRVDQSGNAGGLTWFWGYDAASQVDAASDTISFHSTRTSAPRDASVHDANDDPQFGFELGYQRELGTFGRDFRWGLETAFGWTDIEIGGTTSSSSKLTAITDSYSLGGIVPPQAPYRGSFSGPSAVISSTPNRNLTSMALGSSISQRIEAALYSFRLGPYLELPLARRWAVQIGGGLSLVYIDSDFHYSTSFRSSGFGAVNLGRGSNDRSDWIAGPYVQAGISFAVNSRINLFGGVQYHHLGSFSQSAGPASASLELGSTVFAMTGVGCSF